MPETPTRWGSLLAFVVTAFIGAVALLGAVAWGATPEETIAGGARRVVKLYGAGGCVGSRPTKPGFSSALRVTS
jgi:hypothetical protein